DLVLVRKFALDVVVDGPGQRAAETGEMGTTILLRDVVRVAVHVLLIGVIPLQSELDDDGTFLSSEVDDGVVDRRVVAVEKPHELPDPALVLKYLVFVFPLVDQLDADPRVEERELTHPLGDQVVVEIDVGEDLRARLEADDRAALVGRAHVGKRRLRLAHPILLLVAPAASVNRQVEIFRKRVDDRHTDAMETARDLVGRIIELPAGMQDGHDHLGGGTALLRVDIHRNSTAVVSYGNRLVRMNRDGDVGTVTGERFVD